MRQRITRPFTREEHGNRENPVKRTERNNFEGSSERRSFGVRHSSGRNFDSHSERRGGRSFDKPSERRSYGRPAEQGEGRPFGERKYEGSSERRSFGGRPSSGRNFDRPSERRGGRSFDKPSERRSYGRPAEQGEGRPFGERKYEGSSERRSFGGRPSSGRNFDRPSDRRGGRNFDKPSDRKGGRSFDKPYDRSNGRPFERKEFGKPAFERKYKEPQIPVESENNVRPVKKNDDGSVRLNKFLANAGLCSRREADEYIAAGLVTVNGQITTEMGVKVFPDKDEVKFNGERVKGERKVYIILNKPKDYVTTMSDPHAEKSVMDLISRELCPERVFPVGRLDRATTGVLLLTNDGELAEKLTHPSYQKKKIYQVDLDKNLKPGDMEQLTTGVQLEDGPAYADEVAYVDGEKSVIGLEIHSGRNRVVRRMFESLGYNVKKLDRVYFAGLTKKNLRRGQWRFLSDEEVTMLKLNFYE